MNGPGRGDKLLHGVKNTTKAILDDQAAYCSFDRQI